MAQPKWTILSSTLRAAKRLQDALLGTGGRRVPLKLRSLVIRPRDNGEQILEGPEILAQVCGIERCLHKMVAGMNAGFTLRMAAARACPSADSSSRRRCHPAAQPSYAAGSENNVRTLRSPSGPSAASHNLLKVEGEVRAIGGHALEQVFGENRIAFAL